MPAGSMRAVLYEKYGPPEMLHFEEISRPEPKAGEVLVRIHAVAVTRADCATREANRRSGLTTTVLSRLVSGVRRPRQRILGSEFAGTIETIDSDAGGFQPGDRVFGSTGFRFGAYADYICIPAMARLAQLPADMTYLEGAAICDGGLNALWCLRQGAVRAGNQLLVYGASGAIGTAGVQLAKHLGAEVTAGCTEETFDLVRSLGAERVLDYKSEDFTSEGKLYDVIFDAVGKQSFARCRPALKAGGRYLATDGLGNFLLAIWHRRFGARKVMFKLPPRYTREDVVFLKELLETGAFRAVVDRVYPFADVVEAARYVETEQKIGNVILSLA